MRIRPALAATLLVSLAAAPALASFSGGGSTPPPAPSSSSTPPSGVQAPTTRQEAERFYGDAYNDVAKAKQAVEQGKDKDATKRFKRALERGQKAVELDSTYHEAWNLVGYASRKLVDYAGAVAAYERCLRLKPDYAPAREYLGETFVEMGLPAKAREQLAWLEKLSAANEAKSLKQQIDAYDAAHPATAAPATAPAGASSDSTAAKAAPTGSGG